MEICIEKVMITRKIHSAKPRWVPGSGCAYVNIHGILFYGGTGIQGINCIGITGSVRDSVSLCVNGMKAVYMAGSKGGTLHYAILPLRDTPSWGVTIEAKLHDMVEKDEFFIYIYKHIDIWNILFLFKRPTESNYKYLIFCTDNTKRDICNSNSVFSALNPHKGL